MTNDNNPIFYPCYYPDGTPVPELLTENEAIRFLRLDIDGPKDPKLTIKHYRDEGLLKATRVGKTNKYMRRELLRFLETITYDAKNPSD